MFTVGVRELEDGLSRALRHHGRPIARIVEAWPSRAPQMSMEGRPVSPERVGDLLDVWPPPPLEPGEPLGSEILAEHRADER